MAACVTFSKLYSSLMVSFSFPSAMMVDARRHGVRDDGRPDG